MNTEERDIITRFVERVSGAGGATTFGASGPAPALPPVDPEADQLLADLFARHPEARYRITQTAYAQEQALAQATQRIQQLQAALQQAQAQSAPQRPGGFFSSLFGGGGAPAQPRPAAPPYAQPQQQYAPPPYQQPTGAAAPGGGAGFLGSALTTAAGVAGGMVAANALMNLFEGHGGREASFTGAIPVAPVDSNPWAAPAPDQVVDQGAWDTDPGTPDRVPEQQPDSSWSDSSSSDSGWSDSSGGDGGGDSWT
jgi:hypothetical protein